MNPEQELDSLFGCCWRGEAPMEALADWLMDRMQAPAPLTAIYEYSDDTVDGMDDGRKSYILLTVTPTVELGEAIVAVFEEPILGMRDRKVLYSNNFAEEFPKWLTEQVEFLYYVLSK